jgi:hypothetical protein
MINLIVRLSIRRYPSKFVDVTMWEHCTFGKRIFGCGRVVKCLMEDSMYVGKVKTFDIYINQEGIYGLKSLKDNKEIRILQDDKGNSR